MINYKIALLTSIIILTASTAFAGGEKECPFINSGDYANPQIEQSCGAHTKTNRGLKITVVKSASK